ncbi:hypothetical protein B0T21DRAFT_32596 [Apiosordaria backusii]|uniref:Uncharacterized protein n=1 Tax=Apiosordaria backusii TaxID=314023 RepID=A0AA40B266_9PEZI|nr:hypothetical protein B0T21DRAFT_32596 [Apiosordaria backusii]
MAPQNADQGSQHIDMNVVPEVCRSECYRAYEETQRLRKTPELCRTDSVFTKDYAACRTCILHRSDEGDDWTNANKFYLQPAFGEFAAYCNSLPSQSVVKTPSSSARLQVVITATASSDTTTQITTTTTLTTEPPKETVSSVSTTTIIAASTFEPPVETSTFVTVISPVVRIQVSSSTSTPPGLPSPTASPPPPPSPPSISLTTTVIIIVIPICSSILLVAGLIYLYFHLRKRRKQKKAALADADKDGSTLSKTSTWEKGEMSARLSTLPRQEMEDWRGVKDLGPHELPVGAPAQEIMDVEDIPEADESTAEEGRIVTDSPTLSASEMVESNTAADSPTLSPSEMMESSTTTVSPGSVGSNT